MPAGSVRHEHFDVNVIDSQGGVATHDVMITIEGPVPVNHAPVIQGVGGTASVTEDIPTLLTPPSPAAVVDADNDTLKMTVHVSHGQLTPTQAIADAIANHTLTAIDGDGSDGTLVVSGSPDALTAAINAGVIFTPDHDYNGPAALDVTVDDGKAAPTSASVSINITPVNDAPTVASPIVDQGVTKGTQFTFPLPANTFNDVDGDALVYGATLSTGAALPGWLHFDAATQTFSGTPGNSDVGTITVKVTATDPSNASASDSFDIIVSNSNTAPVNTVSGPQTVNEDTALAFTSGNGNAISVDDVDGNLASTQLSVLHGTLAVAAGGAGISGNNSATLTLSGTEAQINATLATLSYQGGLNFNGSDTLTVKSTDGAAATDTDTVAIQVTPVNDAPVNTVSGPQTVNEDTHWPLPAVRQISVDDVDGNLASTKRHATCPGATLAIRAGSTSMAATR